MIKMFFFTNTSNRLYPARLNPTRFATLEKAISYTPYTTTAFSLDSIDAKYKLAINDVRRLHNRVLLTQVNETSSS